MKPRYLVSILATVVVLALSLAYLATGILNLRVVGSGQTTVTISAAKSNGIHAGSAVLYRGVPIGKVDSVVYTGKDISITASFDANYSIPTNSTIAIENQSMIGESGLFLTPDADNEGPAITDGQQLTATSVEVPASVPELLGSTQTLLDQVDPDAVNRLVETLSVALHGTDGAVARLTPAAKVLAATMISAQPALVKIIRNGTSMLQRGEWIGPSLRPAKAELIYAGDALSKVVTSVKPFADFTDGGELIGRSWKPTLERGAKLAGKLSPPLGSIAETLLPAAQRSGSLLATLNIATLIEQAMLAFPGDSLRLSVNLPN